MERSVLGESAQSANDGPSAEEILASETNAPNHIRKARLDWSGQEDETLRKAVKQFGGKNWKIISKAVGTRSATQCMQRWSKALMPGLKKGHWSKEEDEILLKMATIHKKVWSKVVFHIENRTVKQIRERWVNHVNPAINHAAFTKEEDAIIVQVHTELGNKWALISKKLNSRTAEQVKIRWKSLHRRSQTVMKQQEGQKPQKQPPSLLRLSRHILVSQGDQLSTPNGPDSTSPHPSPPKKARTFSYSGRDINTSNAYSRTRSISEPNHQQRSPTKRSPNTMGSTADDDLSAAVKEAFGMSCNQFNAQPCKLQRGRSISDPTSHRYAMGSHSDNNSNGTGDGNSKHGFFDISLPSMLKSSMRSHSQSAVEGMKANIGSHDNIHKAFAEFTRSFDVPGSCSSANNSNNSTHNTGNSSSMSGDVSDVGMVIDALDSATNSDCDDDVGENELEALVVELEAMPDGQSFAKTTQEQRQEQHKPYQQQGREPTVAVQVAASVVPSTDMEPTNSDPNPPPQGKPQQQPQPRFRPTPCADSPDLKSRQQQQQQSNGLSPLTDSLQNLLLSEPFSCSISIDENDENEENGNGNVFGNSALAMALAKASSTTTKQKDVEKLEYDNDDEEEEEEEEDVVVLMTATEQAPAITNAKKTLTSQAKQGHFLQLQQHQQKEQHNANPGNLLIRPPSFNQHEGITRILGDLTNSPRELAKNISSPLTGSIGSVMPFNYASLARTGSSKSLLSETEGMNALLAACESPTCRDFELLSQHLEQCDFDDGASASPSVSASASVRSRLSAAPGSPQHVSI